MQLLKAPQHRTYRRAPCSFAELMELYENNYIHLRLLIPELANLSESALSEVPECMGLHLRILDRGPFTTTLHLHYRFSDPQETVAPHIQIRVYHDARIAEVVQAHDPKDTDFANSLSRRWRNNRFLFKWLNYCLKRGHRFPSANS